VPKAKISIAQIRRHDLVLLTPAFLRIMSFVGKALAHAYIKQDLREERLRAVLVASDGTIKRLLEPSYWQQRAVRAPHIPAEGVTVEPYEEGHFFIWGADLDEEYPVTAADRQRYAEGGSEPAARAEESRLELVPADESNAASPKPKQPAPTKKTKNRTGGRGPKPGAVKRYAPDDRALFPEILRLMSEEQLSLTAATQRLAENERVVGEGTPTSRARRLARLYKAECLRARRPHH